MQQYPETPNSDCFGSLFTRSIIQQQQQQQFLPQPRDTSSTDRHDESEPRQYTNRYEIGLDIDINQLDHDYSRLMYTPTIVARAENPSLLCQEITKASQYIRGGCPSYGLLVSYGILARDYLKNNGLFESAVAVSTQPPWITEFGSAEDLDARKHYSNVLAHILWQQVAVNETLGKRENIREFSCSQNKLPSISLRSYVDRVMKYAPGTKEMYIVVLIFVDRLLRICGSDLCLTVRNVHRIFVISVVLASKFFDDLFYTNRYLSTVAGVSNSELNNLEIAFLAKIKFNLCIHGSVFNAYRKLFEQIVSFARSNENLSNFFATVYSSFRENMFLRQQQQQQQQRMMSDVIGMVDDSGDVLMQNNNTK